jgi:hypothetical protein
MMTFETIPWEATEGRREEREERTKIKRGSMAGVSDELQSTQPQLCLVLNERVASLRAATVLAQTTQDHIKPC